MSSENTHPNKKLSPDDSTPKSAGGSQPKPDYRVANDLARVRKTEEPHDAEASEHSAGNPQADNRDGKNTEHRNQFKNAQQYPWWADLNASRNIKASDKNGYEILLSWFEGWRLWHRRDPGQQAAHEFWKVQILGGREREDWQKEQWAAAFRWYLQWLEFCLQTGKPNK